MPDAESSAWPHAPTHQLQASGAYFVTAGTYLKSHFFANGRRLQLIQDQLGRKAAEYGWKLEAWAVFSNHYHFVAHSPGYQDDAKTLQVFVTQLHSQTATMVNEWDKTPHRKVWHNYWETHLTFPRAYLARLNYVHQNAVRHGLVAQANQYPWCSAPWFERSGTAAQIRTLATFNAARVKVKDDYDAIWEDADDYR